MKIERKGGYYPLKFSDLIRGQVYGRSDGRTILRTESGYVLLETAEDYRGGPTGSTALLAYVPLRAHLVIED